MRHLVQGAKVPPKKFEADLALYAKLINCKLKSPPEAPPAPVKRTPIEVYLEVFKEPPTRERAIEHFVLTGTPEKRADAAKAWRERTYGGTPIEQAPKEELEIEAVALVCCAIERKQGPSQGVKVWKDAARTAYHQRQRTL